MSSSHSSESGVATVMGKNDQPIVYDSRFLNRIKYNYNTIEKKALAMVFCFA
jgi:hypothetical protein